MPAETVSRTPATAGEGSHSGDRPGVKLLQPPPMQDEPESGV